jgi:hypothetical protein
VRGIGPAELEATEDELVAHILERDEVAASRAPGRRLFREEGGVWTGAAHLISISELRELSGFRRKAEGN